MPDENQTEANRDWISKTFGQSCQIHRFIAPNTRKRVGYRSIPACSNEEQTEFIFIQVGGGVQERLGLFLKKFITHPVSFVLDHLAFLSGEQTIYDGQIPPRLVLRCVHRPKILFPRYLKAFRLVYWQYEKPARSVVEPFNKSIIYIDFMQSATNRFNPKQPIKRASVHTLSTIKPIGRDFLGGKLREAGYDLVPFGEPADLGVINTCTVTNEADAKSRNAIRRFSRNNPKATTVVVGCYSQISANEVAMVDGVDYVIGNHDKLNFLEYLSEEKPETPVVVRERIDREDFSIGLVGEAKFEQRANLKIQDGCDFMCSFCIIPFARGRARSRDWKDLLGDARRMIDQGVRELILTGVNLGTYQSDGRNFMGMIEGLSELKSLNRLRISSIEPTTIPEGLFPLMADPQHPLMPYLHVPMQAGCDRTLERMKRRYNLEEMEQFFDRATALCPIFVWVRI